MRKIYIACKKHNKQKSRYQRKSNYRDRAGGEQASNKNLNLKLHARQQTDYILCLTTARIVVGRLNTDRSLHNTCKIRVLINTTYQLQHTTSSKSIQTTEAMLDFKALDFPTGLGPLVMHFLPKKPLKSFTRAQPLAKLLEILNPPYQR